MSVNIVRVSSSLIAATVDELRSASTRERVILWLGEKAASAVLVREVFVPEQYADSDYFHIPRSGMEEVLSTLRARRWMVAAQVHTHPAEAFHSGADDRWAIVRHVGALSLVIPRFCKDTTVGTFIQDARVFQMTTNNEFVEVNAHTVYQVIP